MADADGRQRSAIVGRVKIETRPLVLVEAATQDGERHSVMLQNAETVRVVGPGSGASVETRGWRAISVSEVRVNDELLVLRQQAARHTGIGIDEQIIER